jgi:hypothetical protein
MRLKNYETIERNSNYTIQQRAIKKACNELGLMMYYPHYHGDKGDNNTVIIYKNTLDIENNNQVCSFYNSDCNGSLNYGFMNHGKIDLRSYGKEYETIKNYLQLLL